MHLDRGHVQLISLLKVGYATYIDYPFFDIEKDIFGLPLLLHPIPQHLKCSPRIINCSK